VVVYQRSQLFTVVLADGVQGWIIDIAPDVDVILQIFAEDGIVRSCFLR
jgi:hypothetical protein